MFKIKSSEAFLLIMTYFPTFFQVLDIFSYQTILTFTRHKLNLQLLTIIYSGPGTIETGHRINIDSETRSNFTYSKKIEQKWRCVNKKQNNVYEYSFLLYL